MAKTAKDWQRLNEQHVAMGNVLIDRLDKMTVLVADQAMKIAQLEKQLASRV